MTDNIKYAEIAWANRFLDCYNGPDADEVIPYWNLYTDGEMEPSTLYDDTLSISLAHNPRGVRITISVPVCPKCEEHIELCETNPKCDFDWKKWEEDSFA